MAARKKRTTTGEGGGAASQGTEPGSQGGPASDLAPAVAVQPSEPDSHEQVNTVGGTVTNGPPEDRAADPEADAMSGPAAQVALTLEKIADSAAAAPPPRADGSPPVTAAHAQPPEPFAQTAPMAGPVEAPAPVRVDRSPNSPVDAVLQHEHAVWMPAEPIRNRRAFNPVNRRAPVNHGRARRPVAEAETQRRQRLRLDWDTFLLYRPVIELPVRVVGAVIAWRFAAEWLATPHPADPGPVDTTYVDPIASRFLLMYLVSAGVIGALLAPFPTTRLLAWLVRSGQSLAPWRFAAGLAGALFGLLIAALLRPALPDVPAPPETPDALSLWRLLPLLVTLGSAGLFGFVASAYPEEARALVRRLIAQARRSLRTVSRPDGSVIDYSALGDGRVLSLAQAGLLGRNIVVVRLIDDVIARDLQGSESLAQQAANAQWTLDALSRLSGVRVIRPAHDGALHDATVALAVARRLRVVTASESVAALAKQRGCPVVNLGDLNPATAEPATPAPGGGATFPSTGIIDDGLPVALLSQDDAPHPQSEPGRTRSARGSKRKAATKMMPEAQR